MPSPSATKPAGSPNAFDGEEPTEVMPVPRPGAPPAKPAAAAPPAPDLDDKDRQYVAPCAIPVAAMPEKSLEGAKVVLNIPSAKSLPGGQGVAEARARRRAPTVKITRRAGDGELRVRDLRDVEPTSSLPRVEGTAPALPPIGLPAPTPPSQRAKPPSPHGKGRAIVEAVAPLDIDVTIDDPPPAPSSRVVPSTPTATPPPAFRRALEAPPTSVPVPVLMSEVAERGEERSRAPWLIIGVLMLCAAGAGVIAATQGEADAPRTAKSAPSGTTAASASANAVAAATTPTAATTAATEPSSAPSDSALASASDTASAAVSVASATTTTTNPPAPATVANLSPTLGKPTATAPNTWTPPTGPRPTFTGAPKPTVKKPPDIPPDI